MQDRSDLLVHLVEVGLVLLAIVALLKRFIPSQAWSRQRYGRAGLQRVFFAALARLRLVRGAAAVLAAVTALFGFAAAFVATTQDPNMAYQMGFGAPGLGSVNEEITWLLQTTFEGGIFLLPLSGLAILALLPVLKAARARATFPFSRGWPLVIAWTVFAVAALVVTLALWIFGRLPATSELLSRFLRSAGSVVAVLTLAVSAATFAAVLLPLLALLDSRVEEALRGSGRRWTGVFWRFTVIKLLLIASYTPTSLALYTGLLAGFSVSGPVYEVLRKVEIVTRLTLVPLLSTAIFPVAVSTTLRLAFGEMLRWWRRSWIFLASVALVAGAANGLLSLALRAALGAVAGGVFLAAAYHAILAVAFLVTSAAAFALVLGDWLERPETVPVQPTAVPAAPSSHHPDHPKKTA